MKYLIVDDEQAARENISVMLAKISKSAEIFEASSVLEARDIVERETPQVIFLDINMPEYEGFDLLEIIDYSRYIVVVVTAHLDYSIRAIRKQVFDFLLKPFGFTTMREVLSRIESEALRRNNQSTQNTLRSLIFRTKKEVFYLLPENIVYFRSDNNYTTVYTMQGQKILLSKTIKVLESEIREFRNFYRVHRSYIVNTDYISKFNSAENTLKLTNGDVVDVSDRKRRDFLEFMKLKGYN